MNILELKARNKELNIRETQEGKTVLESRPTRFWFNLTGQCNLQCAHCASNVYGRVSTQDVDERVYEVVLKEIMPYAYECLLGGTNYGEALLSKSLKRFFGDCKNNLVRIALTTNGTVINDDIISDLVEISNEISFSMEGMREEYEKIRHFKWERFLNNVKRVVAAKRLYNKNNLKLKFKFTAHADNITQLPELIEFSKEIGINSIQVMLMMAYVKEQKNKTLYYNRALANNYFTIAQRKAEELKIEVTLPPRFYEGSFEKSPKVTQEVRNNPCSLPWNIMSVNELGVIKPCCVYYVAAGDLKKTPFLKIWNGKIFQKLRKTVNTKPDKICFSCKNREKVDFEVKSRWRGYTEKILERIDNMRLKK
ncbi:MAG: radical SAM protein [Candidatus Omnitrophica bacterium]|nr:radical SAM protein [Candidatus Omnitrophota bacterium]